MWELTGVGPTRSAVTLPANDRPAGCYISGRPRDSRVLRQMCTARDVNKRPLRLLEPLLLNSAITKSVRTVPLPNPAEKTSATACTIHVFFFELALSHEGNWPKLVGISLKEQVNGKCLIPIDPRRF